MSELAVQRLDTPIGCLTLVASEHGLCFVAFEGRWDRATRWLERRFGSVVYASRTLDAALVGPFEAYFAGDCAAVDHVVTDTGGTEFQRQVWTALRDIPAGATASYSDIARAIGRPAAVRAVGAANGQNPVSITIPCHRVIGAGGSLTGYGGGLPRKRWLLEHEGALAAPGATEQLSLGLG